MKKLSVNQLKWNHQNTEKEEDTNKFSGIQINKRTM